MSYFYVCEALHYQTEIPFRPWWVRCNGVATTELWPGGPVACPDCYRDVKAENPLVGLPRPWKGKAVQDREIREFVEDLKRRTKEGRRESRA